MKILVTGAAGFIGYHTVLMLMQEGHEVIGIDNINDYYSPILKFQRLNELGIKGVSRSGIVHRSEIYKDFSFIRMYVEDVRRMHLLFKHEKFDVVIHLAAQAGVRQSYTDPQLYIDSNITGFMNVLECCRYFPVQHLIYASSSSVYGLNKKVPFSIIDKTDAPANMYGVTKKCNELMANSYRHLFDVQSTGLRFFTVYGPWGRPDMAYFSFTEAIMKGELIKLYGNGKMKRDFTYIDDVIMCLGTLLRKGPSASSLYNIGNENPVSVVNLVSIIERELKMGAKIELIDDMNGEALRTHANMARFYEEFGYSPTVTLELGMKEFIKWYKNYIGGIHVT